MPRFFCNDIKDDTFNLSSEDKKHITKSLRMKDGEEIHVCDSLGYDYTCRIQYEDDDITVKIISKKKNVSEPSVNVTLYQAMPKNDKFEFIVKKAVELGVYKIVPVITNRCISRPKEKAIYKKIERYNKIALEAAKQSGRGKVPIVENIISFNEAIENMKKDDVKLFFYELGGEKLKDIDLINKQNISFMIGSEGGFDSEEASYAINAGLIPVGLGKRILRCETAPLTALSCIMLLSNNLE